MDEGGISKRLINVAKMFIGSVYGGLGYVMIVVALFFAAISGSGTATVAAVGSILIPAMISEGYDKSFSGALSAISGSLGTIIPPSISFVVYGMITGLSIGDLFISGFIPGILYALALCVIVFYYSRKYKWRGSLTKYTKKEKLKALGDAFWGILSPVIVLGGIYGGIFTATEAAAVASVYSIIVGMFIYKDMNFKGLIRTLKRSVATTGVIMLIVACAGVFLLRSRPSGNRHGSHEHGSPAHGQQVCDALCNKHCIPYCRMSYGRCIGDVYTAPDNHPHSSGFEYRPASILV